MSISPMSWWQRVLRAGQVAQTAARNTVNALPTRPGANGAQVIDGRGVVNDLVNKLIPGLDPQKQEAAVVATGAIAGVNAERKANRAIGVVAGLAVLGTLIAVGLRKLTRRRNAWAALVVGLGLATSGCAAGTSVAARGQAVGCAVADLVCTGVHAICDPGEASVVVPVASQGGYRVAPAATASTPPSDSVPYVACGSGKCATCTVPQVP